MLAQICKQKFLFLKISINILVFNITSIPVGYNNMTYVYVGKPCIILSKYSVAILVKQLDQSNKFWRNW